MHSSVVAGRNEWLACSDFTWRVTDGCDCYPTGKKKMALGRKRINKCHREMTDVFCERSTRGPGSLINRAKWNCSFLLPSDRGLQNIYWPLDVLCFFKLKDVHGYLLFYSHNQSLSSSSSFCLQNKQPEKKSLPPLDWAPCCTIQTSWQ